MSTRQDIINNMIAAFGAIDGTGPYTTRLAVLGDGDPAVFSGFPANRPLDDSQLPAIVVIDHTDEIDDERSFKWDHTLNVRLVLVTKDAGSAQSMVDALRVFVQDVQKVIGGSITWGDKASYTKYLKDALITDDQGMMVAGATIDVEVGYETDAFGNT